jgi:hypothetical protein
MSKKSAAILLSLAALSAAPMAIAPVAQADVCGEVGGRHVAVGGCTPGIGRDAVDAAVGVGVADAAAGDWARYGFPATYAYALVPSFPGEAPCISPTGLEYYTPGAEPCYVP